MKKIILMLAVLCCAIDMSAVESFDVDDICIVPEKRTTLEISLYDIVNEFIGFEFKMVLPSGLRVVEGSAKLGSRFAGKDHVLGMKQLTEGEDVGAYQFVCLSYAGTPIPDINGPIVTVELEADASLTIGSTLQGLVKGIEFPTEDAGQVFFNDVAFDVDIVKYSDGRIHLEETSIVPPVAKQNVDVTVQRSFIANEWSTIVLPFAMNGSQIVWAFGEDVQVAEFTGYEVDESGNDISAIRVLGDIIDISNGMLANHPYLIKVSRDISEFFVDGVNIVPSDNLTINLGTKWKPKSFIGTYVTDTKVEDGGLFLCNNAFFYSTGETTIKAFRGYFFFIDVPSDYDSGTAGQKISLVINSPNGSPTEIYTVLSKTGSKNWYGLDGKKIIRPRKKGLYINGKKKVVVE